MNLPFEAIVALRYMRAKRRGPVSLITVFTVFGVALGVAALTVVTSVWNGFEAEFLEKLLGFNAHTYITKRFDVFRDYRGVQERLSRAPGIRAVQPFVLSEVMIQSAKGVSGVAVKGIAPTMAKKTPLSRYVSGAALDHLEQGETATVGPRRDSAILIGKELAETLHVEEGDPVTLISPSVSAHGQPRTRSFRVAGIFHSGMYEFDGRWVFIHIRAAQSFFRLFDTVSGVEAWSTDPVQSDAIVRTALARETPDDPGAYEPHDWSIANRPLFKAVRDQKALITLVLGFIVVVAAFNIVATLILLILEKNREIAVMKSLGASNRSILFIFVLDGQIVGFMGCAIGVVFGLLACAILEAYGLKLDPRVYYLENLPIVVRPLEVVAILAGAMTASTIATIFPALKAARLAPVDGLRHGTVRQRGAGGVTRTWA